MEKQKHVCGRCKKEFSSEEKYLEHVCEETGHTPKEPEHFTPSEEEEKEEK